MVVSAVRRGEKEFDYSYKSVYRTRVTLNNGGPNWSVGDSVTVSMEGKDYTIKVEQIEFGYTYEAEATASYSTPADTESRGARRLHDRQ